MMPAAVPSLQVAQTKGVEPLSAGSKPAVLPLHHACILLQDFHLHGFREQRIAAHPSWFVKDRERRSMYIKARTPHA